MKKSKIRAITFDLDNTLIDFMLLKRACIRAAIDSMIANGLHISRAQAQELIYEIYSEYGIEYQRIFDHFLKKVKGKVDYKLLGSAISAYRRTKSKYLLPYPKVIPTLKALKKKGYKLAILTDAPRLQAWIRLCDLGLQNIFDLVLCYEDTKAKKVTSQPVKVLINRLKLKPEEILLVGDSVNRDIKPAKKLGLRTCWAKYGYLGKEKRSGADFEIKSISGLMTIV